MSAAKVEAPSGTVTFVFTDIEGSTRLFHRLGDRYVEVLDRHNELLRAIWTSYNGYEVSNEGDAFVVAFGSASDAVRACVAAQTQLISEPWPEDVTVAVRIGAHTGLASPHRDNYVALAVHQASRVVAAAHGGLVLATQDTVDAADTGDEFDVELLGSYRLRDFDEPLQLYQISAPGQRGAMPALRAVPADGHNIVRPPTATIGRDEIIAEIADRVDPGRSITLTGPGGIGKSRIIGEVGIRIAPAWPDGVWLVDLAGVGEPELLGQAVGAAVGAPASPGRERWDDVLEYLADHEAVVILDNAEHLLEACRQLVLSLSTACPQVAVLIGSRLPLHVGGEVHWPIDPLDLPGTTDDGDAVVQAASVRLFADRAAAARPDFTIDGRNRAVVANICRHLDGIPLSIELAAARLAIQSLTEIQEGISERFQLLRSPDRHVPERHRSVEELLAWSYRSLSDAEQAAFRAVSVFSSGFSISTAVPALSSARIEPNDVAMLVWSLVDRSLVVADLSANETRYRLLETMRSYGRGLLDEHGEMGAVANAVGRAMMNQIGPWFVADRRWMGVVAVELDNLRTLIGHIPTADQELAQQIACTIGRYHDASQTFRDGIEELSRLVDLLPAATPTRVALLTDLAYLRLRTGDVDQARLLVDTAADLLDEVGVPEWDDVAVDRTRGELARRSGDFPGAVKIAREALERPLTDRGRSRMFNLLGTSSAALGDMETAYEALNDELVLDKVVGYHGTIAAAQGNLAEVAMRLGDIEAAALHQAACLELGLAQGSTAMVAFSLIVAARIAGGRQDWATATRLHAKGEELLEETGLALYDDDRDRSDELLAEAREALGNETFASLTYRDPQLDLPEALVMAKAVFSATGLETTV